MSDIPASLFKTARLVEAFARWSRVRRRHNRVALSGIYRLYKTPSATDDASDHVNEFSFSDIMACFKAWRSLPWRYNRLILFHYVFKTIVEITSRKAGIKASCFENERRKALELVRDKVEKIT
jgi:hypothetical protein